MWTKEDLQGKYIKITSEEEYKTVIKVLEELGINQDIEYLGEKYQNRFNSVFISTRHSYFLTETSLDNIPIKQFYDYLSSKTLKVEDLVEGEIYYVEYEGNNGYINLSEGKVNVKSSLSILHNYFKKNESVSCYGAKLYRVAKPEEKKWLNVCIKQDKFIEKKDLDLYDDITFELKSLQTIPEYVECVKLYNETHDKIGEIYQRKNKTEFYDVNNKYKFDCSLISSAFFEYFKPSTKEAFDLQNKPKFEINKWYSFNWKAFNNLFIVAKVSDVNNDSIIVSFNNREGKHFNTDGFFFSDITNVKELSINEIQQYLPDNHPDKIKVMENKVKEWSAGTYVVITGQYHSTKIGEVHKLDNYINDEFVNITSSVGLACMPFKSVCKWFATKNEAKEFAKTLTKPMESKSLVGRYLKYIGNNTIKLPKYGDYFQITVEKSGCNLLRLSDNAANCSWVYEDVKNGTCKSFELMPEGFNPNEVKSEWIPQVGDWVIVKNYEQAGRGNGILTKNLVTQLLKKEDYPNASGCYSDSECTFVVKEKYNYFGILNNHIIRKAEPHKIPVEVNILKTQEVIKEMSKEELLAEAKRKYPSKTKVKGLNNQDGYIVWENHFTYYHKAVICDDDGIWIGIDETQGNYRTQIYNKKENKWAEIIELPESKTFDLSYTKIRVNSPEESRLVQEKAFELGWKWQSSGKNFIALNSKYLYFYDNYITHGTNDKDFQQHKNREIFLSDLGIGNITKLELPKDYVVSIDPYKEYPLTPQEAFQQEGLIDTNVNKIQSVSVELYQPEELQLF